MNFKSLRQECMIVANTIAKLDSSRQVSLAFTNMQEAMMFTGNFMKYAKLGDNPYAKSDGNRKTKEDIEPMFDITLNVLQFVDETNQIQKVDTLRQYIDKLIERVNNFINDSEISENNLTDEEESLAAICIANQISSLMKSRMWLGMELGRLRDA